MRVMFIQPPMPSYGVCTRGTYPSLGQILIASYLDEKTETILIDGLAHPEDVKENELKRRIIDYKPDIVGIRVMFINYYYAMQIAKIVKYSSPNTIVSIGGPHATLLGKEILEENSYVDVLIKGEGELSFKALCNEASVGSSNYHNIKGIIFRDGVNIIETNQSSYAVLGDKMPRYDLLDMDFYKKINLMTIEGKRGCANSCIFCGFPQIQGNVMRFKPVKKVVDELKYVHTKYGITKFEFVEPNFTINKRWVETLCSELVEENMNISFVCRTYVELVDPDILRHMKEAGCVQIFYGIESGSQKILNEYKRPAKVIDSVNAVRWTKEVGIKTSVNYVIGAPSETEDTVDETINLAKQIKADEADVSILAPFPNTEYYNHEGIKLIDNKWYKKLEYVSRFPWFVALETKYLSSKDLQYLWLKAVRIIEGK